MSYCTLQSDISTTWCGSARSLPSSGLPLCWLAQGPREDPLSICKWVSQRDYYPPLPHTSISRGSSRGPCPRFRRCFFWQRHEWRPASPQMIYFMPRRHRFELTVDLVFLSLPVDDQVVPGISFPLSTSKDTAIRDAWWHSYLGHVSPPASRRRRRW